MADLPDPLALGIAIFTPMESILVCRPIPGGSFLFLFSPFPDALAGRGKGGKRGAHNESQWIRRMH